MTVVGSVDADWTWEAIERLRAEELFPYDERWNGARISQEDWHFHRRLWTRYGIVLRPGEYSTMRRKLRKGKARLFKRRANGSAVYVIYMRREGIPIFVVAFGERMMTVLPPGRNVKRFKNMQGEDRTSQS